MYAIYHSVYSSICLGYNIFFQKGFHLHKEGSNVVAAKDVQIISCVIRGTVYIKGVSLKQLMHHHHIISIPSLIMMIGRGGRNYVTSTAWPFRMNW